MKRGLACLLAVILLFLLCACGTEPEQLLGSDDTNDGKTITVDADELIMAYHSAYSLDPFGEITDLNREISKLCFEPLFALDNNMLTYAVLASSIQKNSDLEYRIILDTERTFWDGSAITAKDVVFSYLKAVASTNYAYLSAIIADVRESGSDVIVKLVQENVNFPNAMTFPIIKKANYGTPTSERIDYVGSGLYIPSYNEGVKLTLNAFHPRANTAKVHTILLKTVPDFEAMNDSLTADIINAGYSEMVGDTLPSVSGNVYQVPLNRMVYVGFTSAGVCTDPNLRAAISLAIDRTRVNAFFGGYSEVTQTPFNPNYSKIETGCTNLIQNVEAAKAKAQTAAFSGTLRLAVNKNNASKVSLAGELQRELEAVGISVKVLSLDFDAYKDAVLYGGCDLYIGEIKLSSDYNFFELMDSLTPKQGILCSQYLCDARSAFLRTGDCTRFLAAFDAELPFIPLVYRDGVVAYSSNLVVTQSDTFENAFYNLAYTQEITTVSQNAE
ncbi:MAG TPA: ABC transporter substrate-binding protein [Oscillospiraceae bacterium]|nr:ABC transporter substrate-binding protein [Oscillospiraceae bacterium]HPF56352.1 ABC transporter substrate-binding protein [Clostridiales bacterium]HPK35562.1 ABC transporter substrate-binding protein [Oscillospiraceae bacterium]HPR75924.1 ABC transporter substrate-binding protein [Oscillospiraceae bacterium]